MSTDQPGPSADNTAERGKSQPASQPSDTKGTLRGIGRVIVELWWRFFDWLAVVPWTTLLIVSFLGLLLAASACLLAVMVDWVVEELK